MLVKNNWDVTVVDSDPNAFFSLGDDFIGSQVSGPITDEDILKSAGIDSADLVVVLTSDDVANLMAGQIARHKFKREKVLLRVRDPLKAGAFREMGLDTICATQIELDMILEKIGLYTEK
jgi:trk system potassium uptake protein TrkA